MTVATAIASDDVNPVCLVCNRRLIYIERGAWWYCAHCTAPRATSQWRKP